MPGVSVIMPVHNSVRYLRQAVSSILSQSFTDFEFIIVDDASTDGTREILDCFQDNRIQVLNNTTNIGIARSLNRGVQAARGRYIARMDGDDVASPDRLARQVAFLDHHPDITLVGSWARLWGRSLPLLQKKPVGCEAVRAALLFDTPFVHPSVVFRRDRMLREQLFYDPTFVRAQDYDLWSRMSDKCLMDNIPLPLLRFRIHKQSATNTGHEQSTAMALKILRRHLAKIGVYSDDATLFFHHRISRGMRMFSMWEICAAEKWLLHLKKENDSRQIYSVDVFSELLSEVWFRMCCNSAQLGPWILKKRKSFFITDYRPSREEMVRFSAAILFHIFKRILSQSS